MPANIYYRSLVIINAVCICAIAVTESVLRSASNTVEYLLVTALSGTAIYLFNVMVYRKEKTPEVIDVTFSDSTKQMALLTAGILVMLSSMSVLAIAFTHIPFSKVGWLQSLVGSI